MAKIPLIDVAAIFAPDSGARARVDAALLEAAGDFGFLVLAGLPPSLPLGAATRRRLLRLFELPEHAKRRLWRKAAAPENPNVYRGYFPLSAGVIKEGMDIGPPDPAPGERGDALTEPTPLPGEDALPGWRELVREVFDGLDAVGATLMRALARGLGLAEATFDAAFAGGISTLRMIRYPAWPALAEQYGLALRPLHAGRYDIGGEHVDSGFVTLLQQDGVEGLQARAAGGWIDVPHVERTLVVNFGKLLERWSAGHIRATTHRVLGNDVPRCSIPFFYEPRVDARIEPLAIGGAEPFEPFTYGDHLWEAMSEFPEFQDAERFRAGDSGATSSPRSPSAAR
jgi:isopenicillin N synthase-like dioxygenase